MTSESYIIILIVALLLLKYIISSNKKSHLINLIKSHFTTPHFQTLLLFIVALGSSMWIGELLIGSALIIGFTWVFIQKLFKSIEYELATWWSFIIFLGYLLASYLGAEGLPNQTVYFLTIFSLGVSLILTLFLDITSRHNRFLTILLGTIYSWLVLSIPIIFISYFITFNHTLDVGQINAIFQTTIFESFEFYEEHGAFLNSLIVFIFLLSTTLLVIFQIRKQADPISGKSFFFFAITVLFILSLNLFTKIPILDLVFTSVEKYETEIAIFKTEIEKRKSGEVKFTATKKEGTQLIVIIIGESLNKNHMGVYGYVRNTTPYLSRLYDDSLLIKYDQAFSNHVHTVPSLTFALTEANQINKLQYNKSPSILDIQEQAGYETFWISNQVAIGGWDNPVSVLAERSDKRFNLNSNVGKNINTNVYDNQLVEKLNEILEKPITQNTVIYLHLMGNHGGYKNRYPADFEKYNRPFSKKNFGSKEYWYQHINEYDNSVLYNDYIVSEIIKKANEHTGNTACVYFSDHADDALDDNGHDQGSFTFPMTQIPMLLWFSESYKKTYPEKIESLKKHQSDLFSNSFIYDLIIGVSDIKTANYNPTHDPSNSSYKLKPKDSFTLHGEVKIDANENYFYHERKNVNTIRERNELNRIFPHRTNTMGALTTILYNGCNSFELDLVFKGTGDTCFFEIGHGENEMSGMKFEEMLELVKDSEIQRIWLDIKNINDENLKSVLQHLQKLDNVYNLKSKVIVETSMLNETFSLFNQNGFHTSYYIPSQYKDYDQQAKTKVAKEISNQIILQQVNAISFDYALYPFVKKYIEPQIDSQVVYHTWNVSLGFQQSDLIQSLDNSNYYHDSRIKTILIKFQNNFEL